MKLTKRFISFVLIAVALLALATQAFASDNPIEDRAFGYKSSRMLKIRRIK